MKRMLKKVLSMLITICLVVGVANIPAYAGATAISATKTTDAVLSKTYTTPATAVKKTTATKTTTITKTTAKKATAAKKVSLTTKIIKKYTKTGLSVLKKLATKLGLQLKTVYNKFVKMKITKNQLKKVSATLTKLMKKGEKFKNCASIAVAKFLGISQSSAALQNLAADISIDADRFVRSNSNGFVGTYTDAEEKVLKVNGYKNAGWLYRKFSLKEFMSNLQKGAKAILHVKTYRGGGHAITIKKEKNGSFSVFDINVKRGKKVTYSKAKFEKLMKGSSYYVAVDNGNVSVLLDTTKILSTYAKNMAKKGITLINKLLNKSGISSIAKTWLNKAKTLVNKVLNGGKSLYDKESWLSNAYYILQTISQKDVSTLSLIKQSNSGIFSSFETLFKNDLTYKIYNEYGDSGINIINAISEKYNLSQSSIYNIFENNKITKQQVIGMEYTVVSDIRNGENVFRWHWADNVIEKVMTDIKELVEKNG